MDSAGISAGISPETSPETSPERAVLSVVSPPSIIVQEIGVKAAQCRVVAGHHAHVRSPPGPLQHRYLLEIFVGCETAPFRRGSDMVQRCAVHQEHCNMHCVQCCTARNPELSKCSNLVGTFCWMSDRANPPGARGHLASTTSNPTQRLVNMPVNSFSRRIEDCETQAAWLCPPAPSAAYSLRILVILNAHSLSCT